MSIYKNEITKEMLEKAMQCRKTVNSNILREERRRVAVIKVSLQNPAIEDSMASCNLHSNLFNSCRTVVSAAVVLVWKISVLLRKS